MVTINYSAKEVCCKIVYYGPGLSGKTTNLQYVHAKVPDTTRGKLISLATEADRTLYFDFLPINIGTINGFQAKFQLYTVPGQVYYNATRKLVLRGVDGLVFVADSQPDKMDDNIESLMNLEENLKEYGYDLDELPMVIQYNKRDLPGVLSVEEMNARLNVRNRHFYEASAPTGVGVFDTLKLIIKLVLDKAKQTGTTTRTSAAPVAQTPAQERPAADWGSGGERGSADRPYPGADRPFPGSASRDEDTTRARNAGVGVAAASMNASTPDYNHTPTSRSYGPDRGAAVAEMSAPQMNTTRTAAPHMAPSLRRREEPKKRGFFKRLFGLK